MSDMAIPGRARTRVTFVIERPGDAEPCFRLVAEIENLSAEDVGSTLIQHAIDLRLRDEQATAGGGQVKHRAE